MLFSVLDTCFSSFNKKKSLFTLQGFPCFTEKSDLQGFPCNSYNFFVFQLLDFPCFNNTFSLFYLHYFPALLTFFSGLIYRVFSSFDKILDLQGFPCIGYSFFLFELQGFPCFYNNFSLFWLRLLYISITGVSLLL